MKYRKKLFLCPKIIFKAIIILRVLSRYQAPVWLFPLKPWFGTFFLQSSPLLPCATVSSIMTSRVLVILAIACCIHASLAQAPVEAPGVATNATTVVRTNWNSAIIEDACSTARTIPCVPLVRNLQRSRFTVTPAAARSYPTGLVLPGFFIYGGINGTYLNDLNTDVWFLLAGTSIIFLLN